MSILIHTYAITRLTANFICGLIWWFASLEKYGHTWHQMSLLRLGVLKQHKPNLVCARGSVDNRLYCAVDQNLLLTQMLGIYGDVCNLSHVILYIGDKVSMLTHTYDSDDTNTNPRGKLKWPYAITRLTAHFVCGLMYDLVRCKFRKSMVIHDTKCPYWDQVSLNNTNQTSSCDFAQLFFFFFFFFFPFKFGYI